MLKRQGFFFWDTDLQPFVLFLAGAQEAARVSFGACKLACHIGLGDAGITPGAGGV